jgi:hypothetical protein
MSSRLLVPQVLLLWSVSIIAAGAADRPTSVPAAPTFTKDVLPILQRSCQACHRPGMSAPMSLLTFDDARPWARSIKSKVETRYMPPWHLDRSVGEYLDDPSLTDIEIATIAKWVDTGAPRGDAADAPPPVTFPNVQKWQFGEEPDLIVDAPVYNVPAFGRDAYPEYEVPSGLTEDRIIKWIQVIPGQPRFVHHVVVDAIQSVSANGLVEGGPALAQTPNAARVGAMLTEYARGNDGDLFSEPQGKLLQAGSSLHFIMHYHPGGEAVVDRSKVGIKFFPRDYKPKQLIVTRGISQPSPLIIPPGEAKARSDGYFVLQRPASLVSFQPHMHYRGKRMILEAILPNGRQVTLTDVNRFTWSWQLTYTYKNSPVLPRGTVLHSIAYHDNSSGNKENPDPTAFVSSGDRTVDEMAIGWLDFYYLSDDEYAAHDAAGRVIGATPRASSDQQ